MRIFISLLFFLTVFTGWAQDSTKRWSLYPLPVVFKSPETDFGFGLGGFAAYSYKNQAENLKDSQFSFGGAYTLNNQVLFYSNFNIYSPDGKWQTLGEAGYYKYFFYYWGIGPNTTESMRERYDVNFIRIKTDLLRRVNENVWAGLRFWSEPYDVFNLEAGGLLETSAPGGNGGRSNGLGLAFQYDSRDIVFFPKEGWLLDASIQQFGGFIGSDFNFTKLYFDLSKYLAIGEKSVLALNLYQEYSFGNVPFSQMALIGGSRKLRGYYKGRYRDHQMLEFQAEYRLPTFWRFGMSVFAGLGQVWGPEHNLSAQNLKWNLGIGGRFLLDKKKKINARGDLGFGERAMGTYITVGEAF